MPTHIEETSDSAATWSQKPFISDELRPRVASADILFTPNQGYMEREDLLFFPAGTADFFDFLKSRTSNVNIEAAIAEHDYSEVARHADVAYICNLLATAVFAPTLVSLIVLWLQERKGGSRIESTTLKTAITFHDETTGRSICMAYDGPANDFEATALAALKQLQQPAIQEQIPPHDQPRRDDQDTP
jgi:hypothetical protein